MAEALTANGPLSVDASTELVRFLAHARFHRHMTLPATSDHPSMRITYSMAGAGSDDSLSTWPVEPDPALASKSPQVPTIIWASPLFGFRLQAALLHNIAEKRGVRVVFVDRPGRGGSDGVAVNKRIPVWLEIIQHLMKIHAIRHVVLAAHSAGTIYQMNAIHQIRDTLSPTRPYVAFFTPWVHPQQSGMTWLTAAKMLPSSWVGNFDRIVVGGIKYVRPAVGASSGSFGAVSNLLSASIGLQKREDSEEEKAEKKKRQECYGMDDKQFNFLEETGLQYANVEATAGSSDDALLCLKKSMEGKPLTWEVAEDYETYLETLVASERERRRSQQDSGLGEEKLRIDAFFGESDVMIGKGGEAYFRRIWDREDYKDVLSFEATTIKGSNHDTCIEAWRGGMEKLFEETKRSLSE